MYKNGGYSLAPLVKFNLSSRVGAHSSIVDNADPRRSVEGGATERQVAAQPTCAHERLLNLLSSDLLETFAFYASLKELYALRSCCGFLGGVGEPFVPAMTIALAKVALTNRRRTKWDNSYRIVWPFDPDSSMGWRLRCFAADEVLRRRWCYSGETLEQDDADVDGGEQEDDEADEEELQQADDDDDDEEEEEEEVEEEEEEEEVEEEEAGAERVANAAAAARPPPPPPPPPGFCCRRCMAYAAADEMDGDPGAAAAACCCCCCCCCCWWCCFCCVAFCCFACHCPKPSMIPLKRPFRAGDGFAAARAIPCRTCRTSSCGGAAASAAAAAAAARRSSSSARCCMSSAACPASESRERTTPVAG